jgi:hypothetical protein
LWRHNLCFLIRYTRRRSQQPGTRGSGAARTCRCRPRCEIFRCQRSRDSLAARQARLRFLPSWGSHLLDEKAGHLASRRNSSERRPASGTDALRKPYFRRRDDSSFTAGASRKTFVDSNRASTCGHRSRVPHGYTDMARTCNRANPHGHERHAADVQPRPQFKFPSACSGFLLRWQITRVPAPSYPLPQPGYPPPLPVTTPEPAPFLLLSPASCSCLF